MIKSFKNHYLSLENRRLSLDPLLQRFPLFKFQQGCLVFMLDLLMLFFLIFLSFRGLLFIFKMNFVQLVKFIIKLIRLLIHHHCPQTMLFFLLNSDYYLYLIMLWILGLIYEMNQQELL